MAESGQALSARFVLVRPLRAGGGGVVWLAQDRERERLVAVKLLDDELMQDVAAVAALQRECERTKALEHPNIVRVDGLYRSAQHAWIAMEYLSGGDLTQLRGRSCMEILRAVLPVAGALAFAHRAGLVHRDLKPANVLLTSGGEPKLADLGVALAIGARPARAGLGSPYSMSPQQLAGAPASPADDVYGFGALLYELLSGYPPFYPDVSEERIRTEPAAALSVAGLPAAIVELVHGCLAKAPQERPADMESIERILTTELANLSVTKQAAAGSVNVAPPLVAPPSIRPPLPGRSVAQGETLRSEWRRTQPGGHSAEELRRQGFRRGLGMAALILGVSGVAGVFFVLPRWVGETQPAQPVAIAKPKQPTPAPAAKQPLDFAALARAKQAAEDQRAALGDRLQKLRGAAVEEWGGADFKRFTDEMTAGDQALAAREYVSASQHFTALEPVLAVLEQRAKEVLAPQLAAGAKALAEGRSADAKAAFELASKIDPKNAQAARGLKRAATLDQVLALLTTAERLERDGELTAAADTYRKALALDNETARASQGLARIGTRQANDVFGSAMARGLTALSQSKYAEARSAFAEASRVRPNAPEVAQALKQIEQGERTRSIAAKLETAGKLESQERWAEALKEYQAVLQLDPTVDFANEGAARTKPRADLNQQLELYLTQPERLFSAPVRSAAHEALQRAAAIVDAGPVLKRQIQTLTDWLARADTPVPVALQSDNLTQVTIYRVGALGTFEQRSLELTPGSYTVVGTRPGYRDVRREINVMPGGAPQQVTIRCEEKI